MSTNLPRSTLMVAVLRLFLAGACCFPHAEARSPSRLQQHSLRGDVAAQDAAVTTEEAVAYTKQWRPFDDKVSEEFLNENAKYALLAAELPHAAGVDRDMFLSQVLPYAHFDEPRQSWRKQFYETLAPHVRGKQTLREAADALWTVWPTSFGKDLHFKGNMTPQIMAPLDTLREGHASCTGFAIFVVNCYRSVGIPARIVGVNEWNIPTGGNHNWFEVWNGSAWMYLDDSPDQEKVPTWNQAWFSEQVKLAESEPPKHAVLSPLWGPRASTKYTLSWRSEEPEAQRGVESVPAIDLTARYAPASAVSVAAVAKTSNMLRWLVGLVLVLAVIVASVFGYRQRTSAGLEPKRS